MVPKPFPYPLSVGVDVCKISRVARLLQNHHTCNQWARRVFTRLEWLDIWHLFQKTRSAVIENIEVKTSAVSAEEHFSDMLANDSSMHMLPVFPESWFSMKGCNKSEVAKNEDLSYEHASVGVLVRHLAGRWAAKEAVIKAHSNRRLYMHHISILKAHLNPSMFPVDHAEKRKPVALIDPQVNTILLDEHVAKVRALRGFVPQTQDFGKGVFRTWKEHNMARNELAMGANTDTESETYVERRAKISESDRQIAEVNISHDGDTAIAMCLALDEQEPVIRREIIIDDGSSLPIHEPQWGDEGWLSKDDLS